MNPNSNPPFPPAEFTGGTHLSPEEGACLMEWVSVLAGEPWSDAPATTHPLLAHLGRLVNDAMTPIGRQALIPLAPRLKGLNSIDPAISAELAELTTGAALRVRPGLRLSWMHAAARRHLRLVTGRAATGRREGAVTRLRRRIYHHGPAHRAVETAAMVLARTPEADIHLLSLLEEAVALLEDRVSPDGDDPARVDPVGGADQR
jgi:hypothetical protein